MKKPMKLLLIEDNPVTIEVIRDMLSAVCPDTFTLECSSRLTAGITLLSAIRPDMVILDLNLPDSMGLDTLRTLVREAPRIPVVVLTVISDEKTGIEAIKEGAQDYLIKGEVTKELLVRSLMYAFERKRMERELSRANKRYQVLFNVLLKKRTGVPSRTNRELLEEIDEKKKTEETLLSLLKAVESMQIGVTITDLDGTIVYTNPYEAAMHGYTVTDLIGKPARMFAKASAAKPLTRERIKTMKGFTRETTNVRKDGTVFPVNLISDVVRNENGHPIYIVTTSTDITERKKMEQELTRLSITDDLTALFNRRHFRRKLGDEVKRAGRAGSPLALLIFDLDNFKMYNDTYGHIRGDEVLREIGRITKGAIRSGVDAAFRYGGDEFAIILPNTETRDAHKLGVRINQQVTARFPEIDISFGVACLTEGTSLQELVDAADKEMYRRKAGKPAQASPAVNNAGAAVRKRRD